MTLLTWGVVASAGICLAALTSLVVRTFSFRHAPLLAAPQGSARRGIIYAFGAGMLPSAKESARDHLPVYVTGMLYHAGIFSGLLYLLLAVLGILPATLAALLRIPVALGAMAGLALMGRRMMVTHLRQLSCPDDFAANLIVDVFLVAAVVDSLLPAARAPFYLVAILMFLYIPAGKIRHCFFFFYMRVLYGLFFGRRGVLPHRGVHET
ncbi:MAG: hypothetical protein MUE60_03465 [Candidatus Eisenbacteria bacterium]|jgi:hypothetical protein|nr:hypothetical protein [Candidatus Eisenbacteria bacterium]